MKEVNLNQIIADFQNVETPEKKRIHIGGKFSFQSFNDKKKELFYSEFEILLTSGIDLRTALELISEASNDKRDKRVMDLILDNIVRGESLMNAMTKSNAFSSYELFSIKIGEESGQLARVISELNLYYKDKISLKRSIVGALVYPIIVLVTAMGAIFFMLEFVVPMFSEIFKSYGSDLPKITKFVLFLSFLLGKYWVSLVVSIILMIIIFIKVQRKIWFRRMSSKIILRIPVLGELINKIYIARFCNSMDLMLSSSVQITEALDYTSEMLGYYPIEIVIPTIKKRIENGKTLSESLNDFIIFKNKTILMIKIGEEVNALDRTFKILKGRYSAEIQHETKLFTTLLEPITIILLGFIVGFVLVAMYLPLFMLGTNIH